MMSDEGRSRANPPVGPWSGNSGSSSGVDPSASSNSSSGEKELERRLARLNAQIKKAESEMRATNREAERARLDLERLQKVVKEKEDYAEAIRLEIADLVSLCEDRKRMMKSMFDPEWIQMCRGM